MARIGFVFPVLHRRRTAAMKDGKNETDTGHRQPRAYARGYMLSLLRSWLYVVQNQFLIGHSFCDAFVICLIKQSSRYEKLDTYFTSGPNRP